MHLNPLGSAISKAKERARNIRADHLAQGRPISHSQALELVAHELGHRDWNTACAQLAKKPDLSLQVGDHVHGAYLKQPFTAQVVSVTQQGAGSHYKVALELDEAVDVVTFDSFSAYRKRVHGLIDSQGQSPAKTSDGVPHLVIVGHVHAARSA